MVAVDVPALTFGVTVLVISSVALLFKMMVLALALDDWWELRTTERDRVERIVADDEAVASLGRVASVALSATVGLVWTLYALGLAEDLLLRSVVAVAITLQALMSLIQGIRAMIVRRTLARKLNSVRRPVSTLSVTR